MKLTAPGSVASDAHTGDAAGAAGAPMAATGRASNAATIKGRRDFFMAIFYVKLT